MYHYIRTAAVFIPGRSEIYQKSERGDPAGERPSPFRIIFLKKIILKILKIMSEKVKY